MSKSDPIYVMYGALMKIGCLASMEDKYYRTPEWRIARIKQISDEALTEMNSEHTKKVQKVLGLGDE